MFGFPARPDLIVGLSVGPGPFDCTTRSSTARTSVGGSIATTWGRRCRWAVNRRERVYSQVVLST